MNWLELGAQLREAAEDAFGAEEVPDAREAYSFLVENPECFGYDEWPESMPAEANIELIAGYYRVGDRVKAGTPDTADYDEGRILDLHEDMAKVGWQSGVATDCPLLDLELIDAKA